MAVAVELVLLAMSGVLLVFYYRPAGAARWNDLGPAHRSIDFSSIVRNVHRAVSALLLLSVMAAAVLLVLEAWRRRSNIAMAVGFVVAGLFASFTGYLLPWDQLSLWAVTVGQDMRGFRPIIGGDTRFVLLGGTEVSSGTFVRWFFVHTAVVGLILLALVVAAWRRERSAPG